MSALKKSGCFKRVLLFAAACFAVAGGLSPARADAESAEIAALRAKAEKGNGLAQYNLGLGYTQGRGVSVDLTEAFVWLSLAAENGTTGKALETVMGKLTDEQLAEAKQRLIARRIALSSMPAMPAAGATRVGGAVKASTGGFNLSRPATPAAPSPDDSAPKTTSLDPQASPVPPPAPPPAEPARKLAPPVADQNLRDPTTGLLQIIGTLRDEKQQLGIELAQARSELEKNRANLADINTELASLKTDVSRLETAAAAAKLTETRLTVELTAAREELDASKPSEGTIAAAKPKTNDLPPSLP